MKQKMMRMTIAMILAVLMTVLSPLQAFAASKPLYISEICMSDSVEKLEEKGYKVLEKDLNAGTGKDFVYIGYKTTTDSKEAITDIAIMDMKGGYSFGDYEEMLKLQKKDVADLVEKYRLAIVEFRSQYEKGVLVTVEAFNCLNGYLEDDSGRRIGDLLIDEQLSDDDLIKIFMQGSLLANGIILMCLAAGIAQIGDTCWLDRVPEPNQVTEDYFDEANRILPQIESLRLSMAKYLEYNTNVLEVGAVKEVIDAYGNDSASEFLDGGAIYEALNLRKHGNGTLATLLMKPDLSAEDLYPIISTLTPGQIAIAETSGMEMLIKAAFKDDAAWNAAVEVTKKQEIDTTVDGTISIYTGVDRSLYQGSVALTSDAKRKSASTGDASWARGNLDSFTEFLFYMSYPVVAALGTLTTAFLWVSAEFSVSVATTAGSAAFIGTGTAVFPASAMAPVVTGGVATSAPAAAPGAAAVGAVSYTAVYLAIGITLAVLAIITIIYFGLELTNYYNPTYTDIPRILMDLIYGEDDKVGDWEKYIRYDVVLEEDGDKADLNNFQGKQWNAMYTTKDKAAGNPITADSFRVRYGDSTTPHGCSPVHYFGQADAFDLNSHCYDNNVGGIFLFFERDNDAFSNATASVFQSGALAIVTGAAGLMLGILGTALICKKKKQTPVQA